MTTIVKVSNLAKDWNGQRIFEQVNLQIEAGERLALIGENGSGKSTLIQLLMNDTESTEGKIERFLPLAQWDWMRQQDDMEHIHQGWTTLEIARQGKPELWNLRQQLDELEQQLQNISVEQQSDHYNEVLEQYGSTLEQYEKHDGFLWEIEVEKQLTTIGITSELWNVPYTQLSGGQKTRVRLASVLTRETQLLILDEPTNHLDTETMEWLEKRLQQYTGTLLFVSHDREFVDRMATSVCELTQTGMTKYKGGYRDYREHKERELRAQESLYKKQEQQRKALEESIRNYQQWFEQAHRAAGKQNEVKITKSFYRDKANKNISRYHAKEKALERLDSESVQKPRDADKMNFELEASEFKGHTLIRLDDVSFAYDADLEQIEQHQNTEHEDKALIQHLDMNVQRGDRIAITGPNGSGKTTLIKLLLGQLQPSSGELWHHPALNIGYFSQELEGLPLEMTLLDSLLVLPSMTRTEAQTILGCFLFRGEEVYKQIGHLSMGEQCRVALIRLYFGGANVLILDEPTNYLDIAAQEVIESALQQYSGTIILVSHDRMLVRRLATRLLQLERSHHYQRFEGTVEEYEAAKAHQQQEAMAGGVEGYQQRMMLELRLSQLLAGLADQKQSHSSSRSHEHLSKSTQSIEDLNLEQPANDPVWQEIQSLRKELASYSSHS
ncbi:ABC-F type ribosomal protection protein [Paenibacillus kyungheensis]|uniref:ABC-F type ribosomal protection protein n=1 Tax=Paenibacillus kyungheensis TaxID=1452732 RepID=A0AAX3M4J3_9BACL|nr:ABC-F type ribosomal protection protein [Paenibacillus kyungheensis]WCT57189.1 ABC-F type ribosomal protection protein [Paenibacillus kyungheensis]